MGLYDPPNLGSLAGSFYVLGNPATWNRCSFSVGFTAIPCFTKLIQPFPLPFVNMRTWLRVRDI